MTFKGYILKPPEKKKIKRKERTAQNGETVISCACASVYVARTLT